MLQITERLERSVPPAAYLTLTYEQRQKSRLRVRLDDGREAAMILPRGAPLRHGDLLCAQDGLVIEVRAAGEEVSIASASNPPLLARACYHLGNRHVALQIGAGWLRYRRDHVLDEMVRSLCLVVKHETASFEPESGAYGRQHSHTHSHEHDD
ncbi:MAG: urease accessory protein UreE [Nitrospinales bacterium]